ncbi:uncharacterized protein LOC142349630 [Convolutriloba macropyga]|uniref:uncharacterized protein LOC142349630 n=1 Tax=Convolutriloba macropyga TaxID=536237 RepID=UPI003F51E7CF
MSETIPERELKECCRVTLAKTDKIHRKSYQCDLNLFAVNCPKNITPMQIMNSEEISMKSYKYCANLQNLTNFPNSSFKQRHKMKREIPTWNKPTRRKKIRQNLNLTEKIIKFSLLSNYHHFIICLLTIATCLPITSAIRSSLSSTGYDSVISNNKNKLTNSPENCDARCDLGQFQCHKTCKCIDTSKVCDGSYLDCGLDDISDEFNSSCRFSSLKTPIRNQCLEGKIQCLDNQNVQKCIKPIWWCDGSRECQDGSDESDSLCECGYGFEKVKGRCTLKGHCAEGQITCMHEDSMTVLCMHPIFQCDGKNDCPKGEDESASVCNKCSNDNYFRCNVNNHLCINQRNVCDTTKDCISGQDETCAANNLVVQEGKHRCGVHSPTSVLFDIDESFKCDGIRQCQDGSDELGCSEMPELFKRDAECKSTSCHHNCRKVYEVGSPQGIECSCNEGFSLASDSYTCVPSLETFSSILEKAYAVLNTGDLLEISLDSFGNLVDKQILVDKLTKNTPITYSIEEKCLIFFNRRSKGLQDLVAYDLETLKNFTLVQNWNSSNPVTSIAYDSRHKLLYWVEDFRSNKFASRLKVASLVFPQKNRNRLHSTGKQFSDFKPSTILRGSSDNQAAENWRRFTSIALSPDRGVIFVASEFKGNASDLIEIYNQDGSEITLANHVYVKQLHRPGNLKIGKDNKYLYFTNRGGRELSRVSIAGDSLVPGSVKRIEALKVMRQAPNSKSQQEIVSFEILSNQIIYSEKNLTSFYTLMPLSNYDPNSYSNSIGAKIIQNLPDILLPTHIVASVYLSASRNIMPPNLGQNFPFSCSNDPICSTDLGICLPKGQIGSTCVCPDNTMKDSVKNVCKPVIDPFVVMATASGQLLKHGLHGENTVIISLNTRVSDIYYDDDFVYWVDDLQRNIQRASVLDLSRANSRSARIEPSIIASDLDHPFSLVVDSANNALFWSDISRKTIEVAFLTGKLHSNVLISRKIAPRHLALDLLNGLIFWTEDAGQTIWQANMDGSNIQVKIQTDSKFSNCQPDEIHFEPSFESQLYFSCSGMDGRKKLLKASDSSNIREVSISDNWRFKKWCFTLFKRSVVISEKKTESYTYHNGETDNLVTISESNDLTTRFEIYRQEVFSQISDPCQNSECSQRCLRISTSPYYACTCFFGYKLQTDKRTCEPREDSDILLLSHDRGIKMLFLDDNPALPGDVNLPGPRTRIGEFDFDPGSRQLYYLQSDQNQPPEPIRRVDLLTGELQRTYAENEDVIAFALDRFGKKLYYAEAYCQCIKATELEPFNDQGEIRTKTIVSDRIGYPVLGIMVDFNSGLLLWTHEIDNERKIERIALNGRKRKLIKAYQRSHGVFEYPAVDLENDRLYYTMRTFIERSNFIERNGLTTFDEVDFAADVVGMTYLKDTLYFGSHVSNSHSSVFSWPTKSPIINGQSTESRIHNKIILSEQLFSVNHMHAYTYEKPSQQILNSCDNFNGHCEFMCFRTSWSERNPSMFSCECPDGIQKGNPENTCQRFPKEFILLPTERIFYPESNVKDLDFNFKEIIEPYSVDFLYRNRQIFIGTRNHGAYSMDFNGENVVQILPIVEQLENIAIDWITENIFWLSKNGLHVKRINGSQSKTLVKNVKRPRGLTIHPFKDLVFYTDWEHPAKIAAIFMDGTGHKIITQHVSWPMSLTIDYEHDILYWVDSSKHEINGCALDGSQYRVIDERPLHSRPEAITFLNRSMYYTERFAKDSYNVTKCDYSNDMYQNLNVDCETLHQGRFTTESENKPKSLAFVTQHRQPQESPRSDGRKSGCTSLDCKYMCLSSNQRLTCACPEKDYRCVEQYFPREPMNPAIRGPTTTPIPDPEASPFAFELKLVMIVLVIIAVVVIILMIAILLLIKRHMIAAPPSPHRAIFTNHDNQPSTTLILHSSQYPPHLARGAGQFPNPIRPPVGPNQGQFGRMTKTHVRPNVYQDLPPPRATLLQGGAAIPHSQVKLMSGRVAFAPNLSNGGGMRVEKPPPVIFGNHHLEMNPPPYSPTGGSSRQGSTGGSSQGSSGNYSHLWSVQPNISGSNAPPQINRLSTTGHPAPIGPFLVSPGSLSNATTPMTFSENSSEDSQQHSNDESSTA